MKKGQEDRKLIESVRSWLENAVIGLNLCPFLQAPFQEGKVQILPGSLENIDESVQRALNDLNRGEFETSLLVLKDDISFEDFYQIFAQLEDSLEELNLDEVFQLVVFHPKFAFEGLEQNDLANLVNRSPFPIIHFLKKASLAKLDLSPEQGTEISLRNEKLLKELAPARLKNLFPWNG